MKTYYHFHELPEAYQARFKAGFNLHHLHHLQQFYPATNPYSTTLFTLIALGIPAVFMVVLSLLALFQPMANPPKNIKDWLIFVGIAAFVLLILAGIAWWVIRLFKNFRLQAQVKKTRKEQSLSHYGLFLDEHLVYRPITTNKQILMLPRSSVRRVKMVSERVEGSNRQYLQLIYFDEDHQQEYFIEMGRYDLDKKYTQGKSLSRIVEDWG